MHDPSPGQRWFSIKYYREASGRIYDQCPDGLRGKKFKNNDDQVEKSFKVECARK